MADRSIILRLQAEITGLKSALNEAAASAENVARSTEKANQRSQQSSVKATSAEKIRASVRKAAAEEEIRANERLRISTEKYGKATATVLQHRDSISTVGRGLGIAGAVAAAGVGLAIAKFAEFDKQMSSVAATGSDARANLAQLRQASIDAGAATQYSATEAAAGVEALLKAGVSAKDVLGGGLAGALNLAAAGNLDVAGSAEAAANAVNQFNLRGADVPHVADLLAQGAGTASGEVSDMAAALGNVGTVAHGFGISIDDTVASLTLFGKQGLVGAEAGTQLKSMLLALSAPSEEAQQTLDKLGISAYDAQGNFVGLSSLAEQLQTKLKPLPQSVQNADLTKIFGSYGQNAARKLFQAGSEGLSEITADMHSFGSATDVAKAKMDNLSGDVEQFRGSLDTALIGSGSGGNKFLREITQDATGAVNAFNKLSPATQQGSLKVAAVGAGALLGAAGLAKLAIVAADTRVAIAGLASTSVGARIATLAASAGPAVLTFLALEAAGHGLHAAFQDPATVTGMQGFSQSLIEISKGGPGAKAALDAVFTTTDAKTGKITELAGGVTDLGSAFRLLNTVKTDKWGEGLALQAENLITPLFGVDSQLGKVREQFAGLDASLSQTDFSTAAAGFAPIAAEAAKAGASTSDLVSTFPLYAAKLREVANEAHVVVSDDELVAWMGGKVPDAVTKAGAAAQAAGKDIAGLAASTAPAVASLADLVKAANDTANGFLSVAGSQINMEQAIDDAAAAADKVTDKQRKSGKALDVHTAAGRANMSQLVNLAGATNSYASALANSGKSQDAVAKAYERGRSKYIETARDMGKTRAEAAKLANQAIAIPKEIRTQYVFAGAKVSAKEADELNKKLKGLPKEQRAKVVATAETKGIDAAEKQIKKFKDSKVKQQIELENGKPPKPPKLPPIKVKTEYEGFASGSGGTDSQSRQQPEIVIPSRIAEPDPPVLPVFNSLLIPSAIEQPTLPVLPKGEPLDIPSKVETPTLPVLPQSNPLRIPAVINSPKLPKLPQPKAILFPTRANTGPAQGAINKVHGKTVAIGAKASTGGAQGAINRIKGKTVAIGTKANTGAAQGAINAIHGKTVTVRINTVKTETSKMAATGGLITPAGVLERGPLRRSGGGPVWGAGTATSDSIDAKLSHGEFVEQESAVSYYGIGFMAALNRKQVPKAAITALGYAAGGLVGAPGYAGGGSVDSGVVKIVGLQRSVDESRNIAELTKTNKSLADATKKLTEVQTSVVDAVKQLSSSLADPYHSKSHDIDDWLESMKEGATDLTTFGAQIKQLKAMGLSKTLIDQITAQGATVGSELAEQILDGGKVLVASLNKANGNLTKAADAVGLGVSGVKGYATGGRLLSGPGTGTSDSLLIRASTGEFVSTKQATDSHLSTLMAWNAGYETPQQSIPAYAMGGLVQGGQSSTPQNVDNSIHLEGVIGDPDRWLRKATEKRRDQITMAGLRRAL